MEKAGLSMDLVKPRGSNLVISRVTRLDPRKQIVVGI